MKAIKSIPMFFHEFKGKAIPDVDLEGYRLCVGGAVANPFTLSLTELEAVLPVIEAQRRFYCVNGWSLEAKWRGCEVASVLDLAKPMRGAAYLRAVSLGGYEDTTSIADLLTGRAMLVTHMNDKPLSPERGKPMRLMLFDKYQFKGVKALARLEIVYHYAPGSWVTYGYTDATIQPFPHLAIEKGEDIMPPAQVLGPDGPNSDL